MTSYCIIYVFTVEKPKNIAEEVIPQNLIELETYCGETAAKAIAAYHKAVCALQDYNKDVMKLVENAGAAVNGAVWQR